MLHRLCRRILEENDARIRKNSRIGPAPLLDLAPPALLYQQETARPVSQGFHHDRTLNAHEHVTEHPPASGAHTSLLFAEEELRQFQRSDLGAAGVVVSLMTGIFLTGLAIYTTILIIITS